MSHRVTVSTWQEVRDVLEVCNEPLELISPSNACDYLGVPFFKALEDQARFHYPHKSFDFILDCGSPGHVMEAFRYGMKKVVYRGGEAYLPALRSMADQVGGVCGIPQT
jgi:hypothetical protein